MYILIGFLIFVSLAVLIYNQLVRYRNLVREALSGMDVQLKRRHDLIPNIVNSVAGYQQHEKNVLTEITRLRSELNNPQPLAERGQLENNLSKCLKSIFALQEAYPDLKASQNFLNLQNNLVDIEDHIQLSRRYYNGTVRNYNIQVESFPQILIARVFGFSRMEFFELEYATDRQTPNVHFEK